MRYFYAQINAVGLCIGVIDTHAPINAEDMIEIESYAPSYMGKTYSGGVWTS